MQGGRVRVELARDPRDRGGRGGGGRFGKLYFSALKFAKTCKKKQYKP